MNGFTRRTWGPGDYDPNPDPEDVKETRRKFLLTGVYFIGSLGTGLGLHGKNQGWLDEYETVSIDNLEGEEGDILQYSDSEGTEHYLQLEKVAENDYGKNFAAISEYRGRMDEEGFHDKPAVDKHTKYGGDGLLDEPDAIVQNISFEGEGEGVVQIGVRTDLDKQILERP